ncbi:HPP family protein [Acinetobacter sp. Marseille-Q1618]|uniref:HPP family protein n=1 Tax=Acinetobacter sp. Marseille-Q1618 TaxID=2697502 RepID=UPI00156EC796|nr:HPP family protein [Acinetobacter sp. Marseille-Q1618]
MSIFSGKEKLAPRPKNQDILRAFVGGSVTIFILLLLSEWSGYTWIMAPFGASCVLLYAVSQSPLAQPRNIILGHFIAAATGLICLKLLGINLLSIAVSVGAAIALMQYLRCVHPPAGANPLVILLTAQTVHYDWYFLIFPVLLGAIVLVMVALVVNNFQTQQKWPMYGLGLWNSKSE